MGYGIDSDNMSVGKSNKSMRNNPSNASFAIDSEADFILKIRNLHI